MLVMFLYYLGIKIAEHNKIISSFKYFLNQMTGKREIIWATNDKAFSVRKLYHLWCVTLSDLRLEESLV